MPTATTADAHANKPMTLMLPLPTHLQVVNKVEVQFFVLFHRHPHLTARALQRLHGLYSVLHDRKTPSAAQHNKGSVVR
jgi:hypothetical protein